MCVRGLRRCDRTNQSAAYITVNTTSTETLLIIQCQALTIIWIENALVILLLVGIPVENVHNPEPRQTKTSGNENSFGQ